MDNENNRDYRTVRGYQSNPETENFSTAMEDYLEMIARICLENEIARIGKISTALHVKPSSASKMVAKLKASGLVFLDADSNIYMTAAGKKKADYLLYRHETIEQFLQTLGSEEPLKETELIEHFLSPSTVHAMKKVLPDLKHVTKNW